MSHKSTQWLLPWSCVRLAEHNLDRAEYDWPSDPRSLNQREVDMDFCDKSHKMNSPELRIKNSELNHPDIEMKRRPHWSEKKFHKKSFKKSEDLNPGGKTSLLVSFVFLLSSLWMEFDSNYHKYGILIWNRSIIGGKGGLWSWKNSNCVRKSVRNAFWVGFLR